ncbi:hypothetical protein [Phenylobacterium sp.]|uniref:hypothetical protein n=1 Tax=Phenylobacterium sp. TaxID=1871053 RepID=UPI0030F3D6C7
MTEEITAEERLANEQSHRAEPVPFVDYHANNRPWRVLFPPVYRYLPQQYVDAFFERGDIMLSSFAQFAKHPDEARGDVNEGTAILRAIGGGREMWALTKTGQHAYVLCGSQSLSKDLMSKFDGCDACIEITNVPDFALEISRHLVGFRNGISGHCIYGGRSLVRHMQGDPFPLPEGGGNVPIEQLFQSVAAAAQQEDLLLKERRFSYQAEHRLLWFVDTPPDHNIVVKAPNARAFCRRVDPAEIV